MIKILREMYRANLADHVVVKESLVNSTTALKTATECARKKPVEAVMLDKRVKLLEEEDKLLEENMPSDEEEGNLPPKPPGNDTISGLLGKFPNANFVTGLAKYYDEEVRLLCIIGTHCRDVC
jgi:hypothetical protein